MAFGSSYAKSLARKAPKPDAIIALGAEPDDDDMGDEDMPDEDGDSAVAASAFDDFARAAGFKGTPAAYAAFKEAVNACMKG